MLAMPQQPMMRPFHQTGAPMQDYQQQQQQHPNQQQAVAVPAASAAASAAAAAAAVVSHNTGTSPPHTNHPTSSSLQNPNSSGPSSTVTAAQPSSMHPNEPPVYYHLDIVQQPIQARAMGWGPKADSRRPVDPPPVINFQVRNSYNENITQDINNNFIVHASLCEVEGEEKHHHHHHHHHHNQAATGRDSAVPNRLTGTTLVSLTHIRSPAPGKFFFLMHDLSIRQEGRYQIVFNVYEVMGDQGCIRHRAQVMSNPITVYSPKTFPGLETSSDLIKEIASQGCRVRVRKESTFKRKKPKRSTAPTLPPSIANNLVQTLHQQQQQQQQTNPGGLYPQQYPIYNQPLDYNDHYQSNALPPPIQHAQQPHSEYTHMYSFEEYRSTPMSATSSVASQPAPAPAPIPPAAPSNGYFRGYEALLSAAAHHQNQHHQHQQPPPPQHHGHPEYHQPMPPTPVYDRDRLGSVSTHHVPMNIRNSRSQSYPMVGFGAAAAAPPQAQAQAQAQGAPQQPQATNMPPPSPKSPHYDTKDHHPQQYDGYQDSYYQQQQQQQPYLTRPAKLVNPHSRVPTPPATAKDGTIDDQPGSAQEGP